MSVRYSESLSDPDLISTRSDIALMDARLEDLLAKVDTGESGETWQALQEAVHEFDKAERLANACSEGRNQDKWLAEREEAMRTIIVLVQAGMSDYAAWSDIKHTLEQRRKLAETEQKRLVAMQQMISSDQAMTLVAALLASVKSHVTDRAALQAISSDVVRLAGV